MTNARLLFLVCAAAALAGCSRYGPQFDPRAPGKAGNAVASFQQLGSPDTVPAEDLEPPKGDFKLGVSDAVEIELMNVPNAKQVCRVMPDGMLYYLMLHGIKAAGLTLPELKAQLQQSLTELYRDPHVTIVLRDVSSQRVWVLGRVNTSGLYPLTGPMTVLEAISRAGGLFTSRFSGTTEELADLHHSFLVRDGRFVPVDFYKLLRNGDLSQNIYLKNGDYIYLPSALSNEIYILGAVRAPKAVGFNDNVTLVSAIAEAKGILPVAYTQRVVIIRGSLTQPSIAVVNLNEILHGKARDVNLQPRDIIWIPNSPWDRVDNYAKLIVNTFVRTIAANEGGRAASEESLPVQSAVPLSNVSPTSTAAPVSAPAPASALGQ